MTFQSLGKFLYPQVNWPTFNTTPSFGATIVDADGEGLSIVHIANASDTITKIGVRCTSLTVNSTVEVRVETVDASNRPTGTLWATGNNGTFTFSGANTASECTLTNPASISAGDRYALVVVRPTGSTLNCQLAQINSSATVDILGVPTTSVKTSAAWAASASTALIWPVFGTAGYASQPNATGITAFNAANYSTSTTPDVIGNVFRFPYDVKVDAIWAAIDYDGSIDLQLLGADGSTVIQSITNAATVPNSTSSTKNVWLIPETTLTANTDYRVVAVPTTTTNSQIIEYKFFNADLRASWNGANVCWKTSAKDPTGAGSFTNDTTAFMPIGLRVVAIDIPTGGGGGASAATFVF